MATRSPHRPNPIGLSLVRVVEIDQKKKRLHISALDLVNGTPVYGMFMFFIFLLLSTPSKFQEYQLIINNNETFYRRYR